MVGSAFTFFTMWWYAPQPLKERLHYLSDLDYALTRPDFLPELSLVVDQPYVPSKVDDYRQFLAGHRAFYLYCVGGDDINPARVRLRDEGWKLVPLWSNGNEAAYRVEAPESR